MVSANRTVLLVNPNRMRPPIAPIGLEYVAADLERAGYEPALCDLAFAPDWAVALKQALRDTSPPAVGVSIRNIDDAYFASQDFILATTTEIVKTVMRETDAPVVLGGIGFSAAPCEILAFTGAPYGIAGDGEFAFPALLDALRAGERPDRIPGVVYHDENGNIRAVPPGFPGLDGVATPARSLADSPRYFREGGQAGIETKRGCSSACSYCLEPMAKGERLRLRPPDRVADEFANLLEHGIDVVHLCDSEFNLPRAHAEAVCAAIVRRGLASRLRWYTYASPVPFDRDLARTMAEAGCAGINFGVDHADVGMLRALGRNYGPEDVRRTVAACRESGIAVMCDMLLGSPGETRASIACAVEFMRDADPDCVGLSCGVRVYPHTPLARTIRAQGPLSANPNLHGTIAGNDDFLRPIFYVDAAIGGGIHAIVSEFVSGDRRFFHADPAQLDGNYNYNDNSVLAEAIRAGARGAYWDILRRR